MSFIGQTEMGVGGNGNEFWQRGGNCELNLRHRGNEIGNDGNELMGMGGNGNAASHSRTPPVHMNIQLQPVSPPGFCNRWGSEVWVYRGSRVRSPPEADTFTAVHREFVGFGTV